MKYRSLPAATQHGRHAWHLSVRFSRRTSMRFRGMPSTPGEISLLNFSACNAAGLLTPWKQRRYALVCAAIRLSGSGLARAQTGPDAGSVLQQIQKQQHNVLPQKSAPQFEPPPPLTSLGGATVTV